MVKALSLPRLHGLFTIMGKRFLSTVVVVVVVVVVVGKVAT